MPCYHPLKAFRTPEGVVFVDRGRGDEIYLPCGRCIGCRLERSRQWAVRCCFESQLHDANSFLTLTYDRKHPDFSPSLNYSHFQLFMKRLRKSVGKVRFFMCGEYGKDLSHPHFHCIIFGHDFPDKKLWSRSPGSGLPLFRSDALERLWPYGFSSIGEVTFDSSAYVARYVTKKITGDLADEHYRHVDSDTGLVTDLVPEFCHMSLKPGIGGPWFDRYSSDVYNGHDYVVLDGRRLRPPKYFDRLLRRSDRSRFDDVKSEREFSGYQSRARGDLSPDRLASAEEVKIASLSSVNTKRHLS